MEHLPQCNATFYYEGEFLTATYPRLKTVCCWHPAPLVRRQREIARLTLAVVEKGLYLQVPRKYIISMILNVSIVPHISHLNNILPSAPWAASYSFFLRTHIEV
jgi:hypothetical protein